MWGSRLSHELMVPLEPSLPVPASPNPHLQKETVGAVARGAAAVGNEPSSHQAMKAGTVKASLSVATKLIANLPSPTVTRHPGKANRGGRRKASGEQSEMLTTGGSRAERRERYTRRGERPDQAGWLHAE